MRRLKITGLLVLAMSCHLFAQETDTVFKKEWISIDTLIFLRDKTKSALEQLSILQEKARQRHLPVQVLKVLIYRYSLEERVTDKSTENYIQALQKELSNTKDDIQKAVLHSMLAARYKQYYSENRWRLYNRKNTGGGKSKDLSTWSGDDLVKVITDHFRLSLLQKQKLQQQSIHIYEPIVIAGNSRKLRPTLYDLLAHEALDYYIQNDVFSTRPASPFLINDPAALQPAAVFATHRFISRDSSSLDWEALKLFQELINFHKNDPNKSALLDVDIQRISWVNEKAVFPGREQLYKTALQEITEKYPSVAAQAWYLLAKIASDKAAGYAAARDTTGRWEYLEALKIIANGLRVSKSSETGIAEMKNLAVSIHKKELSTQTELVNIPGRPILVSVGYRNTDTLFTRLIRLREKPGGEKIYSSYRNTNWKTLTAAAYSRSTKQLLPVTGDHQKHVTEFGLDALEPGSYALLASSGRNFIDSVDKLSVHYFEVSNISYVKNKLDIFVLNRQSGAPMSNVKIAFLHTRYLGAGNVVKDTLGFGQTDKNGYYHTGIAATNAQFAFITPGDTLRLSNDEYFPKENDTDEDEETVEERNRRMFFFTDRSIYRPGQTVYFKGIAVTRDKNTQRSKLITSQTPITVYLKDVNSKPVDSIKLALNDYGSITGSFRIPQNVLTGNFRVEAAAFNYSAGYFSVEEYKRPTFSVVFEKPKGAYRLNEPVVVTGSAKAYSGNAIDNAKVVYSITRNKRYMDPWFWRRPSNANGREIDHGEIKTDANGKFTIRFDALADDISDSTGNPVFEFSIKADITDINGETRSQTTRVTTGFQSLLLNLYTADVSNMDSTRLISIATTNMSGEKEAAVVRIKISSLQTPRRPMRTRMLPVPDQFIMDKSEFEKYFPSDAYAEDNDHTKWPVEKKWIDRTIDTKVNDSLLIPAGQLAAGFYKIEAITRDKYNKEIKQTMFARVFNAQEKYAALLQGFSYAAKDNVEPGQTASFLNGIFTDNAYVIRALQKPQKKIKYSYDYRKAGVENITYTAEESDRGNVSMDELFIYDNRIYSTHYNVRIPWTNKMLDISYTSYRDKTEPGSAEKWTVNIKGKKGEAVAAELLTGMYDASLDQFKPHSWEIPALWNAGDFSAVFNGYINFRLSDYPAGNDPIDSSINVPEITYDQLAGTADEIWTATHEMILRDENAPESLKKQMRSEMLNVNRPVAGRVAGLAMAAPMMDEASVGYKSKDASEIISIRGNTSQPGGTPLYVVDGKMITEAPNIDASDIASVEVLNYDRAIAIYGSKAANGVIVITTKAASTKVQVRKNFNETAFFFPQLYADSSGTYSFSFTMPEALTQWKWMSFAHTKDLSFGGYSTSIVTQKKLMTQANAPRFMREGDNIEFSAKIVNMSEQEITGQATLELVDPVTNTAVDGWFQNVFPAQYFTVEAGQSFPVKFPIQIPFGYNRPLTWRIKAVSGNVSDGEENTLPILTNRMLVTETLPLFLPRDTTAQFTFDKLLNNKSESLTQQGITVEYTSNPVWYAVQALPYLMEYPYECSEQNFNRFYANVLAAYIVNKSPRIKQVFEQWRKDSSSLKSNLQKNEELKQVLLQETPWVIQAENEEQQKKNIAMLFDLVKLSDQTTSALEKLLQAQLPDGSFPWFKGGNPDQFITNYVLKGLGKLKQLGALDEATLKRLQPAMQNAVRYMDSKITEYYDQLVKQKTNLNQYVPGSSEVDYLYMRSFFGETEQRSSKAYNYFLSQSKKTWIKESNYQRAQLGLVSLRSGDEKFATGTLLPAILENAVTDTQQGLYWKSTFTNSWFQSPVEHQSMMIGFVSEINQKKKDASLTQQINAMRTWLLLNKQTNNWRTTIATADACYALLLNGTGWLNAEKTVNIRLGKINLNSSNEKQEAGTGYFKKRIEGEKLSSEMGNIAVTVSTAGTTGKTAESAPSWGSVYWQYFEDLDKITPASSPLSVTKKLFTEHNTDKGKVLDPVKENQELTTGDKIVVRLELRSDRDMDYLHLKDMRASAMEPVNVLSGYKWQDGLGYYESTKDASTNFFIDHLRKGTYVFDYPLFVTHTGIFSVGIASIQCMYAPEFTSHSAGIKIRVK